MSRAPFLEQKHALLLAVLVLAGCASDEPDRAASGGEAGATSSAGAGAGGRAGEAGTAGSRAGAAGEAPAGSGGGGGASGAGQGGAPAGGAGSGGAPAGGTAGSGAGGAGSGAAGSPSGGNSSGGGSGGGSSGSGAGATSGEGGEGGEGTATAGPCDTPEAMRPVLREWAVEVLGGTEFGGSGDIVRRFAAPVRVSLMQGTDAQGALLDDVVGTLGSVLDGTGASVTSAPDADDTAQILVWFAPYGSFTGIAAQYGFTAYPDNWGQFYVTWNVDQAYTKAFVLIASDLLTGEGLVHFTFEEVTQALGPSSDSSLVPESIFYANGADGGDAQGLACYDEALLYLLYAHLEPGGAPADVTRAFDAAWDVR